MSSRGHQEQGPRNGNLYITKERMPETSIMAQRTTFMTLPTELRELVYEYIALTHATRRVRTVYSESISTPEHKITTSAMTATCRLIHKEYEDVARKNTTGIEISAIDLNFNHIINYFHRHVDGRYLSILQLNKAIIHVNLVVSDHRYCKFDMKEFYTWALFLIDIKLEATYQTDHATWMDIFDAGDPDLTEQCVVEEDSSQGVRDSIEEIRKVAGAFDTAMWRAYPEISNELQARRHREFDRNSAIGLAEDVD